MFLSSTENTSGMKGGDGLFHSIYANQIFDIGNITYNDPYRLFEGEKVDGKVEHYPIHYTQYYHLGLGIFNEILGLSVFSFYYTIVINLLIVCFAYFILYYLLKNKAFASIGSLAFFFVIADRTLYINFMEPYLILQFLVFVYCLTLYEKKGGAVYWYMSLFFLSSTILTKHVGIIYGFISGIILTLLLLKKKQYSKLLFMIIVVFLLILLPYFRLWNSIGTIGYGVGSLDVPNLLGLGNYIEVMFDSKYQMPPDWEWIKLSYQQEKTLIQYIDGISNYYGRFGIFRRENQIELGIAYILLILLGIFSYFKENKKNYSIVVIILFFIALGEITFLIGQGQNFKQYYHMFNYGLLFFTLYGILRLHINKGVSRLLGIMIVCLLFIYGFFTVVGNKIYFNYGRYYYENEQLYKQIGDYVVENVDTYSGVFLASDPQFGFYSQHDYIWYPDIRYENADIVGELQHLVDYYGVQYILVVDDNYEKKGFYDYIPPLTINLMRNREYLIEDKIFNSGTYKAVIFKINKDIFKL